MKRFLVTAVALALALVTVSAYAQKKQGMHGAAPAKDTVKAPLEDLTLTGKVGQTETTRKGKDGVETKVVKYTLTETDGTIVSLGNISKAGAAPVDLAKYVGKDVKIVGQGRTETNKVGKKTTHLMSIATIEEVLPPPPAAPAAAPGADAPAK